uniref:Succinate dehydrogenase [ubiquinone] cytochrome b small subunit n=1 Tax=Odontella aurita TaxID=265563 RepID=A0A6U6L8H1_9STRA|mmetsp:Transcript_727/g.2148  ORF Transcript_727/g.2148 Transcript_727/m.2148 type:complete len:154 (+) Transcript_727:98-559(+)
MFRLAHSTRSLAARRSAAAGQATARRFKSASGGPLEADSNALSTHAHHAMITSLAVATPVYFMTPDSMTDGLIDRAFGVAIAVAISGHSWIGLNYVATDYVPKISKSLLGPSRLACGGFALVTLGGLGKIALSSKGGVKGVVKGLWNPPPKEA